MRKAVIETATGLVENIIVVDGEFDPGPGKELRDATDAKIGGRWNGAKYLPPPVVPPRPARFEAVAQIIEAASWDAAKPILAKWLREQ